MREFWGPDLPADERYQFDDRYSKIGEFLHHEPWTGIIENGWRNRSGFVNPDWPIERKNPPKKAGLSGRKLQRIGL
jgi:hypothetical protein